MTSISSADVARKRLRSPNGSEIRSGSAALPENTRLEEEISLMERMMVMVSMDSGQPAPRVARRNKSADSLGRHHTRMRLHAIRAAGGGFILQRHQLPAMFGGRHEKLSRRSSLLRSLFPIQTQSHPFIIRRIEHYQNNIQHIYERSSGNDNTTGYLQCVYDSGLVRPPQNAADRHG